MDKETRCISCFSKDIKTTKIDNFLFHRCKQCDRKWNEVINLWKPKKPPPPKPWETGK